jgi:hypothetical protein
MPVKHKDGSMFFSKSEVIKQENYLTKMGIEWRVKE